MIPIGKFKVNMFLILIYLRQQEADSFCMNINRTLQKLLLV